MPCYYISWETAFISDNLIVRIMNDKTLCSTDRTVVKSIPYSSTSTNWMFGVMTISNADPEMASIPQHVNYGLSMMKYQGHKVAKARISIHANCPLSHCIAVR